jgi:hypothetical protein
MKIKLQLSVVIKTKESLSLRSLHVNRPGLLVWRSQGRIATQANRWRQYGVRAPCGPQCDSVHGWRHGTSYHHRFSDSPRPTRRTPGRRDASRLGTLPRRGACQGEYRVPFKIKIFSNNAITARFTRQYAPKQQWLETNGLYRSLPLLKYVPIIVIFSSRIRHLYLFWLQSSVSFLAVSAMPI